VYEKDAGLRDTNEVAERTFSVRGGWLCDEVGMGKTCVCVALILANPCTDASTKTDIMKFVRALLSFEHPRMRACVWVGGGGA
jgi:hypothetical protein